MIIDLAVFDIAGTTVDEGGTVYQVLEKVVRAHGADPSDADIRAAMGADKREAISALLDLPIGDSGVEQAHREFAEELAAAYRSTPPEPFPGVEDAIATLRTAGIKVALTTGFDKEITGSLLAALGWHVPETLDAVVCADDVSTGRPAPLMILRAMELTGVVDADRVLVAGDTVLDVRAGRAAAAGMVVGVLTGAHTADELDDAEPTHVLGSLADLPKLLALPAVAR